MTNITPESNMNRGAFVVGCQLNNKLSGRNLSLYILLLQQYNTGIWIITDHSASEFTSHLWVLNVLFFLF